MVLKAELQSFIERIPQITHVHSLLNREIIMIRFECEQQLSYLSIIQNQCQLTKVQSPSISLSIKGGCEAIKKLVNGSIPLQKLLKEKQLEVQATYRSLLLLESIFFLSRKKNDPY